jgi:hypothetical protein
MVDAWRNYAAWRWDRFLRRKRGDHHARKDRCAYVLDASIPLVCPRTLKRGNKGPYCPKHQRVWDRDISGQ